MPKISARETITAKLVTAMGRASTARLENRFISGRVGFLKPVGISPNSRLVSLFKVKVIRYYCGYNDHQQLYGEWGLHLLLILVIDLFYRRYDGQSNQTSDQVTDAAVLDISEKVNLRQDEGPHPFMTRDF